MAASPRFKIFDRHGNYRGCMKDASEAAVLMAFYGDGAQIRNAHCKKATLYTEGVDGMARESYDAVATIVYSRENERRAATSKRIEESNR